MKNNLKIGIFIIAILVLLIGGYLLTGNTVDNKMTKVKLITSKSKGYSLINVKRF